MLFTFFSYVFLHLLATTKFYTLSLHDALPIFWASIRRKGRSVSKEFNQAVHADRAAYYRFAESRESDPQKKVKGRAFPIDRKSTRLNSSHVSISYAVFCLKKKKSLHYGSKRICKRYLLILLVFYTKWPLVFHLRNSMCFERKKQHCRFL